MTNRDLAKLLKNIAASYIIKDEKKFHFQLMAYQKAADAIETSTTEVKDLIRDQKLELLPGVGPTIRQHIEELFKTGESKHFQWVKEGIPESVFVLLDVPSIGPKKAYKLVQTFGLENPKTVIDELKKVAEKGKIASLPGFGEKSQSDIIRALTEFKAGAGKVSRMTLPFAGELAIKLVEYLKESPVISDAQPLGSLRRRKETVGDIDIAISTSKPEKAIEHFTKYPSIDRLIEKGPVSVSALISGGRQVDIIALPTESFGSLLQHFTGSKNHNIHLRELALKKGLSLSERGIKKQMSNGKWQMANYETEEKFYEALGMDWIPPEIREDTGEIELALQRKLPKLVELSDMKADFHIHSSFPIEPSHDMGKDSMENMLTYGKKLGYEYMGFSEHNPSISKHTKNQVYSILAKRKEKIEHLNSSKKYIRSISLLETDILPSGELAIDDKALECLEGTIVSVHSVFSMGKDDMTKRVLAGLSHPKAKILAHPTGRLLNERPGYELDWDKIFDFCKKNNKALEINGYPNRLDLADPIVRLAVQSGIKMTIDTDSHALWQMDMMKYGVAVARRGWATKHDILNCLSYNEFINWLNL